MKFILSLALFAVLQARMQVDGSIYIGCYVDDPVRDLDEDSLDVGTELMTVERCAEICSDYDYFGVQFSYSCWCGNSFGTYGRAEESQCDNECSGDSSQICGGIYHNSVYTTGDGVSSLNAYVGCYVDDPVRDLNDNSLDVGTELMTNERCRDEVCAGYTYYATQFSYSCWCGESYGTYGSAPESECDNACSGDSDQICGGIYRNSVYTNAAATYIGCFIDDPVRDMNEDSLDVGTELMTNERCLGICREGGYAYFATQFSYSCWCGNSFGTYGAAPASECDNACSGDSDQICGGIYKNSVYRINV